MFTYNELVKKYNKAQVDGWVDFIMLEIEYRFSGTKLEKLDEHDPIVLGFVNHIIQQKGMPTTEHQDWYNNEDGINQPNRCQYMPYARPCHNNYEWEQELIHDLACAKMWLEAHLMYR